jgi:hypothetical protein
MNAGTNIRACALCCKPKELRDSHIVPNFLWKQSGVKAAKKTFALISPTHPKCDEPHRQDGLKEYLLCHDCEQQFNRYETYAAGRLFHKNGPIRRPPDNHFVWEGLEYRRLKLFQMSILWRMGVSSHPYYSGVELGKHEGILRTMLNAEDPGDPWQYGCIANLLNHSGKPIPGIFSQPLKTKKFGQDCFSYTISGMHWTHFLIDLPPVEKVRRVVLQRDGTWVLFRGEITDSPELRIQVNQFRLLNKEPQHKGCTNPV